MRLTKHFRFNLVTALLFTALIAWSLAWGRSLDAPGVLLGHGLLLLTAVAWIALAALLRRFGLPWLGAYRYPLYIAAFASLPLLYLASAGPAIWICARYYNVDSQNVPVRDAYNAIYEPAAACIVDFPDKTVHDFGIAYLRWWMPERTTLIHHGRYLGLYSVSKKNPSRGFNYRMPCYFTLGG